MDFVKGIAQDIEKTVKKGVSKARAHADAARGVRPEETSPEYQSRAAEIIPADVRMFSGCMDAQTSADVSDVSSFGLPPVTGPEKAGGACTNALLSVHGQNPNLTFGNLLTEMQTVLKRRRYSQIPQLSSSKQINLKNEKFTVLNPKPSGRTKALLIGINYYGQKGELSGCVNDVKQMKSFVASQGFSTSPQNMIVLTDDPSFSDRPPTGENIIQAMKWLVADNQPGDSLFFHYSGHGGQIPDDNGDEEDGMDETLIPVDYAKEGQIRDDLIFKLLVVPLKEGCHLLAVFDCCHSGTILDLPYMFAANEEGCCAMSEGSVSGMSANPLFNFAAALQMVAEVARGIVGGLTGAARGLPGPVGGLFGK